MWRLAYYCKGPPRIQTVWICALATGYPSPSLMITAVTKLLDKLLHHMLAESSTVKIRLIASYPLFEMSYLLPSRDHLAPKTIPRRFLPKMAVPLKMQFRRARCAERRAPSAWCKTLRTALLLQRRHTQLPQRTDPRCHPEQRPAESKCHVSGRGCGLPPMPETACAQIAAWAVRKETAQIKVAVNRSVRQFRQLNFAKKVLSILDRSCTFGLRHSENAIVGRALGQCSCLLFGDKPGEKAGTHGAEDG